MTTIFDVILKRHEGSTKQNTCAAELLKSLFNGLEEKENENTM